MIQSVNPFNEEVLWEYPLLSSQELQKKIELSVEVQKLWKLLSLEDRAELFLNLEKVLIDKKENLAETISLEMGKTLKSARAEIEKSAFTVGFLAKHFSKWSEEEQSEFSQGRHRVSYEPLGVTLGIMPWNFPVWQAIRFMTPSLLLGNTVLLKPASNVFRSSLLLEEALLEAGFPEGVYQHLSLDSKSIAQVISSSHIKGVSLTGSAAAGKAVAKLAGQYMKKTVFELGGSDPYIVMEDADLELAASKCAQSRVMNAGQSCICAKRFIVDRRVFKEFTELFLRELESKKMGDPFFEGTDFGPLARKDLRNELHQMVLKAKKSGGKILLGGVISKGQGFFYPATLIQDVDVNSKIYQEEFFGPVALLNSYETMEEAFEIANRTPFGLGSGIFSQDTERAEELARLNFQAGMSVVNDYLKSDVRLPFGGVNESGVGRELGRLGVHEFANIKSVSVY